MLKVLNLQLRSRLCVQWCFGGQKVSPLTETAHVSEMMFYESVLQRKTMTLCHQLALESLVFQIVFALEPIHHEKGFGILDLK